MLDLERVKKSCEAMKNDLSYCTFGELLELADEMLELDEVHAELRCLLVEIIRRVALLYVRLGDLAE